MIKGKSFFYEKLREIKAFSMVKRSLRDETYKRKKDWHLPMVTSHRTEGNGHKLKYRKVKLPGKTCLLSDWANIGKCHQG